MRILYKTLASVGMLALSTVAAIGIRRLVKRKRSREQTENDETQTENPSTTQDESMAETSTYRDDAENGVTAAVTVAETDIQPMTEDDDSIAEDKERLSDAKTDD